MSLSKVFGNIISPFVQNFKDAKNEKQRLSVIKEAADAVLKSKDLLEDKEAGLPKDLPSVRNVFN